jgi:hypothetical protein
VKIVNFEFLSFSKSIFSKVPHFPEESWTTIVYLDLPQTESVVCSVATISTEMQIFKLPNEPLKSHLRSKTSKTIKNNRF